MRNEKLKMNKILFGLILSVVMLVANEPWFAFTDDTEKELIGYKDKNGTVKIEPIFISFLIAQRFDNIIAVIEDKNETYEKYYLLKSGKKVGHDTLYISDNTPDCESEGYIRFEDKKSELIGMFNSKGKVAIPAQYNALRPMHNGLIVALKGAKKEYDNHDNGCNHFFFKGGTTYLIDKNNKELIKDFNSSLELNFFSMKIVDKPLIEPNRENFLGINGKYYSFINDEKEFKSWIFSELIDNFSKEKFLNKSHDRIAIWSEDNKWILQNKELYYSKNFEVINRIFNYLKKKDAEYFIGSEDFLDYGFSEFKNYYNSCGRLKKWKNPIYSIVVSYKKGFSNRDSFSFLKTDNGYRLVSASLRTK